jgi:hypothetical protein
LLLWVLVHLILSLVQSVGASHQQKRAMPAPSHAMNNLLFLQLCRLAFDDPMAIGVASRILAAAHGKTIINPAVWLPVRYKRFGPLL